jgi:hypothetical protein
MGIHRISTARTQGNAAASLLACLCAGALLLTAAVTMAQERGSDGPKPSPQAQGSEPGFLDSIVRWFDQQTKNFTSNIKDARSGVENFSHEAGVAAKTTVEGAKDAADAVARIPTARVVTGHEKCTLAPNGAPDCLAAANIMCKSKGFASGKSADMTTAEVCPAQVYLSGRSSGPECRTETFVSRAFCQ